MSQQISRIVQTCGVKPEDEIASATLLLKLGIEDVIMVLQTRCLHWYGHVLRAESSINSELGYPWHKKPWKTQENVVPVHPKRPDGSQPGGG